MSVSTVATANPPMIANAIGPQKTVGAMGIKPEHRRNTRQHDWAETGDRRLDHGLPWLAPLLSLRLDLLDEDDGVAGNHAKKRQYAEDRDKAEGLLENEKRRDNSDKSHRNDA